MVCYMKKFRTEIMHSFLMVRKNLKNYVLLSVTIVLSFSFLLLFFIFSDSNTYNKYKEDFSIPPTVAEVSDALLGMGSDSSYVTSIKHNTLIDKLKKMENTQYFQYYSLQTELNHYSNDNNTVIAQIFFMPNDFIGLYMDGGRGFKYIEGLSGECAIKNPNEIIVDKYFYDLISQQNNNQVTTVDIPIEDINGVTEFKKFKIVGVATNHKNVGPITSDEGHTSHFISIYMSQELLQWYNINNLERRILINSDNISEVIELGKNMNLTMLSSYTAQLNANKEIRNQIFLKGITIAILFSLLGINLYSSFNNALKERCFEIGVKRAIGAGKKDIISQFFFEGLIVMFANALISIFIALNISVVYKFIKKLVFNNQWTIYINQYSVILFLFSVIFLSISFSLLFAYQSTLVEIVKHLKSE